MFGAGNGASRWERVGKKRFAQPAHSTSREVLKDDVVRFVFRNMMFNHGISCEVCCGKTSVSKNKLLEFINDSLFLISKDSRLSL